MPVLIERESELAALAAAIDAAVGGRGAAVMIEGEAGIGKTSLLADTRGYAQSLGARVLFATADEAEAGVPLAVARALLVGPARRTELAGPARLGARALDGGLAGPAGPGSRADEVVHGLWWLMVELADERPLVVCVDDAQWADELTLRLLRLAARRATEFRLGLVVAARPASSGDAHAMLAAERAFARAEPAPLSVAGTARLLESVTGQPGAVAAVARLRAVTGGNPLYLSELCEDARARRADLSSDGFIGDAAPRRLVAVVGDRLTRLPAPAASLAHAIAVLGNDADPRRARSLARLDSVAAMVAEHRLRAERLLDVERYAFAHPVVGTAVRDSLRASQAADLHERAAALLLADGVGADRVADQLLGAPARGDPAVVETLRRAAESARRLGAPGRAARLLDRAQAEPPAPDALDRVEFECARARLDAGDDDGATRLGRVLERTSDVSVRIDAAQLLARRLGLTGRGAEAMGVLQGAIDTLDADRDRAVRLELLADLACTGGSDLRSHAEARRAVLSEAAHCSGRTPGERLVGAVALMIDDERPPGAADAVAAAQELLARRVQRDYPTGFAVGSLSFWATATLINADALDDADRAMEALREDADELGLPPLVTAAIWQRAQIAYQRGDLAACELDARNVIEIGGDVGRRLAAPWLVMTLSEQDRLDEAQNLLAAAGLLGTIPPSIMLAAALSSRGRLRLAQGDAAAAVDDLSAALDRNAAWRQRRLEPPWRPLLIEALVLADRPDDAAAEARGYASQAAVWGTARALGHAARVQALTASRPRAIERLDTARGHFLNSHARLELARCLLELGARRRAAGERRTARAILRDAHDAAHACRATGLCRQARAELLLAGGRPRPPAGAGTESLTAGERRVAELAATGATNREIARRLYLSPKTVEMHLRSTYRKLDLPGRDRLAAALD